MTKLVHYSGAGNTFFLADNRKGAFRLDQVKMLCQKGSVDGIILVENQTAQADAVMRIFNKDGSEAEMCGNGLRCFIHFLKEIGIERQVYHIETLAGLQKGWLAGQEVCVQFSPPTQLKLHLEKNLHFINTGVPHAVIFVDALEKTDVELLGEYYRFSPLFAPAGTNVDFVALQPEGIAIRTYERGVEGETPACGTGAVASALIAHKIHNLSSPIEVTVRSKEKLKISFTPDWSTLTLQGPAKRMK